MGLLCDAPSVSMYRFIGHYRRTKHSSTHYAMLYTQNGDGIVAIDSATSFHSICIGVTTMPWIQSTSKHLDSVESLTQGRPQDSG